HFSFIIIFFFQAEDGIRDRNVTGVQTCALPILWDTLNDTMTEIEVASGRGDEMTGVPTGFHDLDELTHGLHPGQRVVVAARPARSEEHTSELQSRFDLVCRHLLEKKNDRTSVQQ